MKRTFIVALLTLFVGTSLHADDTELYTNNTSATAGAPLVMFTIDMRSNVLQSQTCQDETIKVTDPDTGVVSNVTSNPCQILVDAGHLVSTPTTNINYLKAVMKAVLDEFKGIRIGLMASHDHTQGCAGPLKTECSGGAYVLKSISETQLTDKTYAGGDPEKKAFVDLLGYIDSSGGNAQHPFQGKELYFEFFRYITGQAVFSGHLGFTDYGDTDNTTNLDTDKPNLMRDLTAEVAQTPKLKYDQPGTYSSPITEDCSKIFTVNFAFGTMNSEDDADGTKSADGVGTGIKDVYAEGGMEVDLTGTSNSITTLLKFMNQHDFAPDKVETNKYWGSDTNYWAPTKNGEQNVTSFWVTKVPDGLSAKAQEQVKARYDSWAAAGGTTSSYAWSSDPEELIDSLKSILNQILSVSTTFTAASVPVSVLNRAQVVDNVYIALFRADEDGKVRWPGNVKKLRLDLDRGLLVDANGDAAIDADGRIKGTGLTYWTVADELPTADVNNGESEGKDGRSVERGGGGQKIPGFLSGTKGTQGDPKMTNAETGARKMFYQKSGSLLPLDADAVAAADLKTDLGAASDAIAEELLTFIRGYDVLDEDADGKKTEAREWIMGDPLHSRPLPINYGNRNNAYHDDYPDIRLVFGTNDGLFHMLKNTSGTAEATIEQLGTESWAFMPREVMGVASKLMANKVSKHVYGVDGAPVAYVYDADNNGKIETGTGDIAWVFFGLRRGGRALYALDVTDPDSPSFKWKITNSTSGFSNLGYTFSTPRIGKLNYDGNGAKPVLIFAAGYSTNKDTKALGTDDSYGKGVYVVDADSGALVWHGTHADMKDSIPADMAVIDTDGDFLVDRGYVGDMGGRVWRVDLVGTSDKWFVSKLADLGRHYDAGTDVADDRRFFHRPDFVQYRDDAKDYDAVIIASGNRSDPLGTNVENFVYMLKDVNITSGKFASDPIEHNDTANEKDDNTGVPKLDDVTDNCLQDSSCNTPPALTWGWQLGLTVAGEKSLATPTTLAKKIYVTTFLPPGSGNDGSCDPDEGSGRLYALSLDDARAVNDYKIDNNTELTTDDRFVTLQSGGIPAEVVYVPFNRILKPDLTLENVGVSGQWDTYWYKEEY